MYDRCRSKGKKEKGRFVGGIDNTGSNQVPKESEWIILDDTRLF